MNIAERLTKANNLLLSLDKRKTAIEHRIEKAVEQICKVEDKINQTENDLEKVVEQKMFLEMREKLWNDISELKKEKRNAEKHLESFRKQLKHKFKKFKQLSTKLQ